MENQTFWMVVVKGKIVISNPWRFVSCFAFWGKLRKIVCVVETNITVFSLAFFELMIFLFLQGLISLGFQPPLKQWVLI